MGTVKPLCPARARGPHLIVAVLLPHVLDNEVGVINDGFDVLKELLLACVWQRQT